MRAFRNLLIFRKIVLRSPIAKFLSYNKSRREKVKVRENVLKRNVSNT